MDKDLLISDSGDLLFDISDTANSRFKLQFYFSSTSAVKIQFNIERNYEPINNAKININFDIDKQKYNQKCVIADGDTLLSQLILIRLKTSLNEIEMRESYGSTLEKLTHLENTEDNLSKIKSAIYDAISDILPNAYITIKYKLYKYPAYKTTAIASIYSDIYEGIPILTYSL